MVRDFPGEAVVKNLPARQEAWIWSLGQKDPLEKSMATHSSILAWEIPQTEEPGGLQSMGLQRIGQNWATNIYFHYWMLSVDVSVGVLCAIHINRKI